MALSNPSAGLQSVQDFIAPGFPYVTNVSASTTHVEYPQLTRSVTVSALVSSASVYFSGSADPTRTFTIPESAVVELPIRVKDIWITTSGVASVLAALSTVNSSCLSADLSYEGI